MDNPVYMLFYNTEESIIIDKHLLFLQIFSLAVAPGCIRLSKKCYRKNAVLTCICKPGLILFDLCKIVSAKQFGEAGVFSFFPFFNLSFRNDTPKVFNFHFFVIFPLNKKAIDSIALAKRNINRSAGIFFRFYKFSNQIICHSKSFQL